MKTLITLINGPNLNLLGTRKPEVYGDETLDDIIKSVCNLGATFGVEVFSVQSNSEGKIIDAIQQAAKDSCGIIINAGAYSHSSIAIRDALEAVNIPIIEVHLSNIFARESFRKHSYVSEVAKGVISGFGAKGYLLALRALVES